MSEPHIHDCTGPDMTCSCGYVFRVPPISVDITIFDRNRALVDTVFHCEQLEGAIEALERATTRLRSLAR